jgi:YggT family protein
MAATVAAWLDLVVRGLIVAGFAYASVVAATHWLVRSRRLQPFGAWPRLVRSASDPVLQPIERRLLRAGGNPQDAPLWLIGVVIVGGLVLLALVRWLMRFALNLSYLAGASPRQLAYQAVSWVFGVLNVALLVRVFASWFGVSEYARWMRPFVWLTDWLLEPIRRRLPLAGPFDMSPMVAYLLLMVAHWAVNRLLFS